MEVAPALVTTVVAAVALTPLVRRLLVRHGVVDHPTARSSHHTPTPRGGGLAVMVATAIGAALVWRTPAGWVLLLAGLLGLLGLVDDLRGLSPRLRLAVQGLVGVAAAAVGSELFPDEPLVALIAVVPWVVAYVNAFNFMDGIDGISASQAVLVTGAFAVAADLESAGGLAVTALLAGAAALGFLPWNLRGAIFLGDSGSYFLGAWVATTAAYLVLSGVPWEMAIAPLAPYLADTGATLVRRGREHRPLFEAHREHTYQELARQAGAHWPAVVTIGLTTVASSALGVVAGRADELWLRVVCDGAILVVVSLYLTLPRVGLWRRWAAAATGAPAYVTDLPS